MNMAWRGRDKEFTSLPVVSGWGVISHCEHQRQGREKCSNLYLVVNV